MPGAHACLLGFQPASAAAAARDAPKEQRNAQKKHARRLSSPQRRSDHATSMPRQLAGVCVWAHHIPRAAVCVHRPRSRWMWLYATSTGMIPCQTEHVLNTGRGARSGVKQRPRRKKARACAPTDRGVATTKGRGSLVLGWPRPGHASPSIGTLSIEAAPIIARVAARSIAAAPALDWPIIAK